MGERSPNILLIVIDCLRADRTFGPARTAKIPTLSRLAAEGTLFTHLITANSMTIPCMTTTFTGMYPVAHGVRAMQGFRVHDDIPLLAEQLQACGYHTYAEVCNPLSPYYRLDRGFSVYNLRRGVEESLLGKWGDDFLARMARGEYAEPWFLYLHLWEVHQPRQVLPRFDRPEFGATSYDRAISTLDARLGELMAVLPANTTVLVTGDHGEKIPENVMEARIERWKRPFTRVNRFKNPLARQARRLIVRGRKLWYAAIRRLHRAGLVESPLITVTGHGYHVYDSLVRVPLIIYGHSKLAAGKVIETPVRQIDLMPTILELAGISAVPETVEGESVLPLIHGHVRPDVPVFIETCQNTREPSGFAGVRTRRWKYAAHVHDPSVPEELYDLTADPEERHNVATQYPEQTAEFRALLQQHFQRQPYTGVRLDEELSAEELARLSRRLENLGYIE